MSTLSSDKEEVRKNYWIHEDAQKLLRSLIRLAESHHSVAHDDILDDLNEAGHQPIANMKTLLSQFCDKRLINKCEQDTKRDYDVPLLDELTPFLNPEFGDVPDEDDFFQSFDAESSGSSEENPIIVPDSDDEDSSDITGNVHEIDGSDQPITMQPQKKRRKSLHPQGCNTNQINCTSTITRPARMGSLRQSPPQTNFFHAQFNGTSWNDQSDVISDGDEQARVISPKRESTDIKDFI
jgi:hypothetical protein